MKNENWTVETRGGDVPGDGGPLLYVVDGRGQNVAFVEGPARRSYLVAAAPELLEAAEAAKELIQVELGVTTPEDERVMDLLRDAIAKAKDEQ